MEHEIMPIFKVTLEIEKIVECESSQRAIELARSDVSESDLYDSDNWTKYELSDFDMRLKHNKDLPIIK
jgi:hypothetical protein